MNCSLLPCPLNPALSKEGADPAVGHKMLNSDSSAQSWHPGPQWEAGKCAGADMPHPSGATGAAHLCPAGSGRRGGGNNSGWAVGSLAHCSGPGQSPGLHTTTQGHSLTCFYTAQTKNSFAFSNCSKNQKKNCLLRHVTPKPQGLGKPPGTQLHWTPSRLAHCPAAEAGICPVWLFTVQYPGPGTKHSLDAQGKVELWRACILFLLCPFLPNFIRICCQIKRKTSPVGT